MATAPTYIAERSYTYHFPLDRPLVSDGYTVMSPADEYEQDVYDRILEGEEHLQNEEYGLALDAFEEVRLLILNTSHPTMPVDPRIVVDKLPIDAELVEVLATQAAAMLRATPAAAPAFPASLIADESLLPAKMQRRLEPATSSGLIVTSFHDDVLHALELAANEVADERWGEALKLYEDALGLVPDDDSLIRGALTHDMAVLADKADDNERAAELGTQSLELMTTSGDLEARVTALDTMVGVFRRAGEPELATQTAAQAGQLRANHNIGPVVVAGSPFAISAATAIGGRALGGGTAKGGRVAGGGAGTTTGPEPGGNGATQAGAGVGAAQNGSVLIASQYVADSEPAKSFVLQNVSDAPVLELTAGSSTLPLLEAIAKTRDLSLVTGFAASVTQMIAYLPHMYFFVIPMAIGDSLVGLGSFEEAEQNYKDTLLYPYINEAYEAVELWTKLADVYRARGDAAYRAARDDTAAFPAARTQYAQIVRPDGTLDLDSALYADATFAAMRTRVQAVLEAEDPTALGENPEIVTRVLEARVKLGQIAAGLNFFGLAPGYLAPFGWEYLQTTARYFAQSASQIEQRYILFKSNAENEELRGEQLAQQADVAEQAVVLEQRGLDEAQAGVDVAQASLDYAEEQLAGAIAAQEEFEEFAWAQVWLDYSVAMARLDFAGAALVLQRARISQDMEVARLERAVEYAEAARDIAAEQLDQAEARIPVVEQRVVIAGLQLTYAEENRDYLDMREFSARLWFDLAAQARGLTRRYLDMAIEVAMLTERAYNAETERGLQLIRYDYWTRASASFSEPTAWGPTSRPSRSTT